MRSVPEWVGKTDDEKVPLRVRVRVFEREGGRCWISGRKIMPGDVWELEHKIALCAGGRHAEDNFAPALKAPHREKTADDLAIKAKIARVSAKHKGAYPKSKRPLKGRGFPKSRKQSFEDRSEP